MHAVSLCHLVKQIIKHLALLTSHFFLPPLYVVSVLLGGEGMFRCHE